jgi:hypothetical protein
MFNCADRTGCGVFMVLWPWISIPFLNILYAENFFFCFFLFSRLVGFWQHTDLPDRLSYYVGGNSGEAGSLYVGLLSGRVVDLTLQIFVM